MDAVKPPAPIRGQARRERAKATHRKILTAAHALFTEQGYAATTMGAIAAAAGVAVQTVYFVFHTKAELLIALVRVSVAGEDDPRPVLERPWAREAAAAPEGHRLLALLVEHGTAMSARLAPLRGVLDAAASGDPDVAAARDALVASRRAGMRHFAGLLAAKGALRPGLTVTQAADILFILLNPDTLLVATVGCGWSSAEWQAWLFPALCQQLLARP